MNLRSQYNQVYDSKESRKISKTLDLELDLGPDKLPDFDDFSFKTLSSTTADSSRDSCASTSTTNMRLRSGGRRSINPFDLSSECGDDNDDFLENKYSLRSKQKNSLCKSSPMEETNLGVTSTIDIDTMRWSGFDYYALESEFHNMYGFLAENEADKKGSDLFDKDKSKRRALVSEHDSAESDRKKPKLSFCYELRQRHHRNYHKYVNQPSPLPTIRESSSNNVYIPEISNQTLCDLLNGRYSCYLSQYTIIDCRFPYEYDGGHINNSINLYTCRQLMQQLIKSSPSDIEQELHQVVKLLDSTGSPDINFKSEAFIFYCEFSSFRGPKLAQCLRGLDRLANAACHPRLKFPHVFVLHGGFNEFFIKYPQLCTPQGYVGMKQTRYCLRSPINPCLMLSSPTSHSIMSESDSTNTLHVLSPKQTDEVTSVIYRKQQINCQRQLKCDSKRLFDIVAANTKNSDIVRLFKFNEVF